MKHLKHAAAVFALLLLQVSAAYAGPPLICHAFDIGGAKSLPFQGPGWSAVDPSYDMNRLLDDTAALLTPDAPVIVHMETLRRATIYARNRSDIGAALLQKLESRARAFDDTRNDREALMAWFDLGYLASTYREAAMINRNAHEAFWRFDQSDPKDIDGYALVTKAISHGGGPEMEFAAALITAQRGGQGHDQHLQKAVAGASQDALLARNLETHFATSAAALRAKTIAKK
jgi:hypothetical protein